MISDSPMTLSSEKLRYLFQVARRTMWFSLNGPHWSTCGRLISWYGWYIGNLVGDLVSVKCAISQDDFEGGQDF